MNVNSMWKTLASARGMERESRLVGWLEQCLFGVEMIKSNPRSNKVPITRSTCCGRRGCCAIAAACVFRLLSVIEVTQ